MQSVLDTAKSAEEKDRKKNDDDLWALLLLLLDDDGPQDTWEKYVPASFAGLITGDGFEWDAEKQQYRSDSGTTVNGAAIQRLVVTVSHAAELQIERDLQTAIDSGDESAIAKWKEDALDGLMNLYTASSAAGMGGIDSLTESQLQAIIDKAADAAESLDKITEWLSDESISPAEAVNRAGLNASVNNGVYQNARRRSHMDATDENGVALFTQERNVLTETAKHCGECPALTEKGWVPIGTLPMPGDRQCGMNCKCDLEYRA